MTTNDQPATASICGARHETYPDTVCTEPPRHRMPHGGPLIIDGRECGGAAWGSDDGYADELHVCKPGASVYYCPTCGETESDCHGGFDVCCDRPDLHQQLVSCSFASLQQPHDGHSWEPQPGMTPVRCLGTSGADSTAARTAPDNPATSSGTADSPGAQIAYRIRAELVCCHIYDRVNDTHELTIRQAMDSRDWHDLCYWGEAAARLAEGHAPDPHATVQAVTREQLHDTIRTLARTDPAWWHDQLRRYDRIVCGGRMTQTLGRDTP